MTKKAKFGVQHQTVSNGKAELVSGKARKGDQ